MHVWFTKDLLCFKSKNVVFQLIQQLKPGGRLIVPVGPEGGEQYLTQVRLEFFTAHMIHISELVQLKLYCMNRCIICIKGHIAQIIL